MRATLPALNIFHECGNVVAEPGAGFEIVLLGLQGSGQQWILLALSLGKLQEDA
jgi:hypothetical protein